MKSSRETGNSILDRLPDQELRELLARARRVSFVNRQEVYTPRTTGLPVYFPLSGVYSLQLPMHDGQPVEVGVVDSEGLLGIPATLGFDRTPLQAVTQVPGECVEVPQPHFLNVLRRGGTLSSLLHQFLIVSWHTANQNVACSMRHSVRQRLCRWLLAVHDRAKTPEFELTHETLAQMVGASRQKVTSVIGQLQTEGRIQSRRGRIRISSRRGLEAASCECYDVLKHAYELLTGKAAAGR